MLENLLKLVKDNAQDAIVNNNAVPNEHNEAAIGAASESIFETLKAQTSSGNVAELASAFNQNNVDSQSPLIEQATTTFTDKLAAFGINTETATGIGASLIPVIMGKFINQTNDPNNNSFNIQDILSNVAGGADGKFEISDVLGMFTGNSTDAATQNTTTGGGILDKLKGLFN